MNINNIYRISALIFPTDERSLKRSTTVRKIVESYFVLNENKETIVDDLPEFINTQFGLLFTFEEIKAVIENSSNFIVEESYITTDETSLLVNLKEPRLKLLQSRLEGACLTTHISVFYNEYQGISDLISIDGLTTLIEKFLYHVFVQNLEKATAIFKKDLDISEFTNSSIFDEKQKGIINSFLDYDDVAKDKAIFDIGSLALEFVSINGNVNLSTELSNLKSKILYLDTNVIFRAIGLNSSNRKERMSLLLDKCLESGQQLRISYATNSEFHNALENALHDMERIGDKHILFEKLDDGLLKDYCTLREERKSLNPKIYKQLVVQKYEAFIKEYKVIVDAEDFYVTLKGKQRKALDVTSNDLMNFKHCYWKQAKTDATNLAMIEQLRNGSCDTFSNTKYYLLTTDKKLADWDAYNSTRVTITVYPSDWISILLKYVSRGKNDYKSFVNFIKTVIHPQTISPEKMVVTLDRIAEIASDITHQNLVYDRFVSDEFKGIKDKKSLEEIAEFVESETKRVLEEELLEVKRREAKKDSELNNMKSKVDSLTSEYKSDKVEFEKNIRKIESELQKNNEINRKQEEELIKHRLDKRRNSIIINGCLLVISGLVLLSYIFFYGSPKNFIVIFFNKLIEKDIFIVSIVARYFAVLPFGLFTGAGYKVYDLFFGKRSKKEVTTIRH